LQDSDCVPGCSRLTLELQPQRLVVSLPTGNTIVLESVTSSSKVSAVKAMIHQMAKIPSFEQRLVSQGQELDDGNRISDYGGCAALTELIVVLRAVPSQLFVSMLSSRRIPLVPVFSTTTVGDLKAMIHEQEGILSSHQSLVSAGGVLQDDRTISECGGFAALADLTLVVRRLEQKFIVKTCSGRLLPVLATPTATVREVKAAVQELSCVPAALQIFLYSGRRLQDSAVLADELAEPDSPVWMARAPTWPEDCYSFSGAAPGGDAEQLDSELMNTGP